MKSLPEATPQEYRRIEAPGPGVAGCAPALRKHPRVRVATVFGGHAHVLAEDTLDADGHSVFHPEPERAPLALRPIEPSLEDVFVSLSRV